VSQAVRDASDALRASVDAYVTAQGLLVAPHGNVPLPQSHGNTAAFRHRLSMVFETHQQQYDMQTRVGQIILGLRGVMAYHAANASQIRSVMAASAQSKTDEGALADTAFDLGP